MMSPMNTQPMRAAARPTRALIGFSVLALALLVGALRPSTPEAPRMIGMADLDTLYQAYERWSSARDRSAAPTAFRIPLGYSKAFSPVYTEAKGLLKVDRQSGQVSLSVSHFSRDGAYRLWWVSNEPGPHRSIRPEQGDRFLDVGRFVARDGTAQLETTLSPELIASFKLDLAVITPDTAKPTDGLIFGAPSAFETLRQREFLGELTRQRTAADSDPLRAVEMLLPGKAVATGRALDLGSVLGERVARGRDLFLNETFDGNGRTCGTCHRPDNNHTIDPAYIAKLPPHDPLFVADTNPALKKLERPWLLRKFGLVLTNIDGFEADKPPIMRSVPHLLGLSNSIAVEEEDAGMTAQAVGWSGDGAPAPGSLKMFTAGAIMQHFPKTLARVPGQDFREATAEELEDIELYMLSLGRGPGEELDLKTLVFKSEFVEKGKLIFDTKQNAKDPVTGEIVHGTGNCNGCHENAGANSSTTKANPTRDTGIENLPDHPARLAQPNMAYDGGFGTLPNTCGPDDARGACFGDHRFNTPSLVEAADTGPFFHNNVVNTIEEAIAVYNQPAFNNSPGALTSSGADRTVLLDPDSINAVGAFLRTINALENLRSSDKLDQQAQSLNGYAAREMIRLAAAETQDAVQVLRKSPTGIYPDALALLQRALYLEKKAHESKDVPEWWRDRQVRTAISLKDQARQLMVTTP